MIVISAHTCRCRFLPKIKFSLNDTIDSCQPVHYAHNAPAKQHAGVVELVDTRDSKSRFFGSAGSIPAAGIFCSKLEESSGFDVLFGTLF